MSECMYKRGHSEKHKCAHVGKTSNAYVYIHTYVLANIHMHASTYTQTTSDTHLGFLGPFEVQVSVLTTLPYMSA